MQTAVDLRKPGSEHVTISIASEMRDVLALFQSRPDLRFLPVLDQGKPVGAIIEEDVRGILYSPYGHALLNNPNRLVPLEKYIHPCPIVDMNCRLAELLSHYAREKGQFGVILTDAQGYYYGVIENRDMLSAAGEYERLRLQRREAQLDILYQACQMFEKEIGGLVEALGGLASNVEISAVDTAKRGQVISHRASAVAAAAGQTGEAMTGVAHHGMSHADTLSQLRGDTASAKSIARHAVDLVTASAHRSTVLKRSTDSIESMTSRIDDLARSVNMLALNAAVEAARAGEAGKGFGIVAAEVRALAGETRSAAEEIRHHSAELCLVANEIIAGHSSIEEVIASVERIARSVDTAASAQQAISQKIAEDADQTAQASIDIHRNIQEIDESARSAAQGASELQQVARTVTEVSHRISGRVETFLEAVRAAA